MRFRLTLPNRSQFSSLNSWTFTDMISAAINLIMVIAVVLFVFQLFIGGLKFMLAAGEKEKTHAATRSMTNAFVGLLIVFGTYAIIGLASNFFGVPLLQFTIIGV